MVLNNTDLKREAGNIWRGAADRGVSGEYIEKFGKFL